MIRRFFLRLFAIIGVVTVIGVVGVIGLVIGVFKVAGEPELPATIVLTADLNEGLGPGAGNDALSRLVFGSKPTLRDFIEALARGGDDPRVKALFLRLGDDALAVAKTQEVRDAIHAFRAKGKFVVAFADTFGELGPGTRPYYLAAAADEIWLQPLGAVGLTGLRSETAFFRGLFDLVGVSPEFARREEYKSAANALTETAMTGPEREEIEALLSSLIGQIERGIAADRKMSSREVEALIDRAPLAAEDAKAARLIDHIGYRDEALARARSHAGAGSTLLSLARYLDRAGRPHQDGPVIALIYATGLIVRDAGAVSPLTDGEAVGARDLAEAFRAARRDQRVRAVLFRIDSPGGSAVASETIWREVAETSAAGKPVVVSMGDTAASGGYYIAAPADKIVAEPGTITGSIGVLAGKLVIAGMLNKLGVTTVAVARGANAAMFSAVEGFTPQGRERLEQFLDIVYRGFKEHVASGRHISAAAVESVAKGRVWSGEDAREKGLVDALGGYDTALKLTREAAKIAADQPFTLTVFPREKGTVELIYDHLFGAGEREEGTLARGIAALRTVAGAVDAATRAPGILQMPPLGEPR